MKQRSGQRPGMRGRGAGTAGGVGSCPLYHDYNWVKVLCVDGQC